MNKIPPVVEPAQPETISAVLGAKQQVAVNHLMQNQTTNTGQSVRPQDTDWFDERQAHTAGTWVELEGINTWLWSCLCLVNNLINTHHPGNGIG